MRRRSGWGKGFQQVIRLDDHQMHVDRQRRRTAHGFQNDRPHRDIGNEAPVHHVEVKQVSACAFGVVDLLAEPGEICCQKRGGNPNRVCHCLPFHSVVMLLILRD